MSLRTALRHTSGMPLSFLALEGNSAAYLLLCPLAGAVCETPGVTSRTRSRSVAAVAAALVVALAACGNPPRPPDPRETPPPRLAKAFALEVRAVGAADVTRTLELGVSVVHLDVRVTTDRRVVVGRPGHEVPLSEVLAVLRRPGAQARADLVLARPGDAAPVWDAVRAAGVADRVGFRSLDWSALRAAHGVAPDAPLVAVVGPDGGVPAGWLPADDVVAAAAQVPGVVAISPSDDVVDAWFVAEAHADGLLVVPWTVDEVPVMKHLIELGVDGLVTDRPDVLRTVMSDSDLALPPAVD